jgi:hypothetical protein
VRLGGTENKSGPKVQLTPESNNKNRESNKKDLVQTTLRIIMHHHDHARLIFSGANPTVPFKKGRDARDQSSAHVIPQF